TARCLGPSTRIWLSWRATWAYALLLTVTTAFTPIVWPIALLLGLGVLVLRRGDLVAHGLRFLAQLGTPLLLLAPWSLTLLPTGFFREAGLEYGPSAASALDLLGAAPGGPGTVHGLMLIGIVLAALAALLRSERQLGIRVAWAVALVGLVFAVLSNKSAWAGPATLVYGIALLAAAALGADGARARVAEQSFGWRQPVAALIAFASAAGPLLVATGWMLRGADGPLERRDPAQVPAFVAEDSSGGDQARTLVLDSDSTARVRYTLVRGSGARMGDAELTAADGGNARLDKTVANLVAGSGADQADELGGFAVRYVLVHKGAPRDITRVLDATPGLSRLSQQNGSALWRVDQQVGRAAIVPASGSGKARPVTAGPVEIHTTIPSGPAGRVLRLADSAADGWTATLDGKPLTRTTVDGWAQGFQLPSGGGRLDVTYDAPIAHTAWLWAQGALAVVLVVLALPGRRRDVDDDLPEEQPLPAQATAGEGRRARRLRAQAEEAAAEEQPGTPAQPEQPPAAVPHQQAYDEWDPATYGNAGNAAYGTDPYQTATGYEQQQYQQPYQQSDPYQTAPYDPYGYSGAPGQTPYDPAAYQQGYDPAYDPAQQGYDPSQHPHGTGSQRPDGSQQ
ncbi:family 2 glycosyl transferase, partial [Streptomyces sp. NPDC004658]